MRISNYEQFKSKVLNEVRTLTQFQDLSFDDDFSISIRLKGEKWDGLIDYDVAQLVSSLQDTIFEAYKSTAYDNPKYKRIPKEIRKQIYVKVKLEKGSSYFEIQLGQVLEAFLLNMNGEHKVALGAIVAFLICSALYGISKIQSEASIQKSILDSAEKQSLTSVANKALDRLGESYRAIGTLEKLMDEKDEVEFVQSGQRVNKPTLQQLAQASVIDDSKPQKHSVDGEYSVEIINKAEDVIRIGQGEALFDSSTKALSDNYISEIHDVFKKAHINNEPAMMNLRVTVTIKDGKILDSHIIGTGPKREDSVTLIDLLNKEEVNRHMPLLELIEESNHIEGSNTIEIGLSDE